MMPTPEQFRARDMLRKFDRFHNQNRHVMKALVRMAHEVRALGYGRWGIAGLYETLRWKEAIKTHGTSKFKLSNDFRAIYARLILMHYPLLGEGFFQVKSSKIDQLPERMLRSIDVRD